MDNLPRLREPTPDKRISTKDLALASAEDCAKNCLRYKDMCSQLVEENSDLRQELEQLQDEM